MREETLAPEQAQAGTTLTTATQPIKTSSADLGKVARGGIVWLGIANAVAKGSQIVLTLAMAGLLSPSELGRFSLAMTVMTYAALLQSMGMYDVINRTHKDPLRFSGTMATASVAAAVVFAILLAGFADPLARFMGDDGLTLALRISAVCLPLMSYAGIQTALITRNLQFRIRVLCDGGSAIVGMVASVILMSLGFGASGAMAGVAVTYLCFPLIGLAAGVRIRPLWSGDDAREAWSWIRVAGPGAVLGVVMFSLDYVVIGRVLGSEATGVYGLGYRFAFMPYVSLALVLAGVAFPIFTHLARTTKDELDSAVVKYAAVMSGVLFGVYAVLAVVAPHLEILGEQWRSAVVPLRFLCVYGALLSLALIPLDALRAAGLKKSYLVVQLVHFTSLVVLLVVLTTSHDIVGAAIAQAVCAGISVTMAFIALARGTSVSLTGVVSQLKAPTFSALLVVLVGLWVERIQPAPAGSIGWLVVSGAAGVGLYALALTLTGPQLARTIVRQFVRR